MSELIYCSKERLEDKIKTFASFGATEGGGVTRLSLSKEALAARDEFCRRMKACGARVYTDDLGDIYARFEGSDPSLPAIMSGSHLDSVRQGGNYDGTLGVLCAMEAAETIATQKIPHRHPITVTVWTNEEGARYVPAMMCSGIITGKFKKEEMLQSVAKDRDDLTFGKALSESGYVGSEENRISAENCRALVELHIEQGPVLESCKKEIGVVEHVVGSITYDFVFRGQADHAGTFPMPYRKDAFLAAAQALLYLHAECDKLDKELVYTTGKISAHPNIYTIIPDEVHFSFDARHKDPAVLKQVADIIEHMPKEFAACSAQAVYGWARDTVKFNPQLIDMVQSAADQLGYSSMRMGSGAGHDAQYLSELVPTTMIFVPSEGGHSHCELEHTALEECWKGANVLVNTILNIDATK